MRYSYEFKKKCVEMYRSGVYPDTPDGISQTCFRNKIREWVRTEEALGPEALKPKQIHKQWLPDEKYELVCQVLAGKSYLEVALGKVPSASKAETGKSLPSPAIILA